jgi:hypothetical protein
MKHINIEKAAAGGGCRLRISNIRKPPSLHVAWSAARLYFNHRYQNVACASHQKLYHESRVTHAERRSLARRDDLARSPSAAVHISEPRSQNPHFFFRNRISP